MWVGWGGGDHGRDRLHKEDTDIYPLYIVLYIVSRTPNVILIVYNSAWEGGKDARQGIYAWF